MSTVFSNLRIGFPGSTIQACRATQRHVLAFEEDKEIFDAIIAPVMHATVASKKVEANPVMIESDSDEEDVPIQKIVKTSRFSK